MPLAVGVMVDGKFVVANRRLSDHDINEILTSAREAASDFWRSGEHNS